MGGTSAGDGGWPCDPGKVLGRGASSAGACSVPRSDPTSVTVRFKGSWAAGPPGWAGCAGCAGWGGWASLAGWAVQAAQPVEGALVPPWAAWAALPAWRGAAAAGAPAPSVQPEDGVRPMSSGAWGGGWLQVSVRPSAGIAAPPGVQAAVDVALTMGAGLSQVVVR